MYALLTIPGWIAFCAVIALAIYGGFKLLMSFEAFIASKFAEDAGNDFADGDVPHVPFMFHGEGNRP